MTLDVVARRVVVHGRVQGVGYRDAAVQSAFTCGVKGWVRNRSDGTVEAHVQGPPPAVDDFLDWCKRGPPLARVFKVDVEDIAVDGSLRDFSWRATA